MTDLIGLLSAGGDIATIAILAVLWRFDRRLLIIEMEHKHTREVLQTVKTGMASHADEAS